MAKPAALGRQLDGEGVTLHGIETQGVKEGVKKLYFRYDLGHTELK